MTRPWLVPSLVALIVTLHGLRVEAAPARYAPAIEHLERMVRLEVERGLLTGLSIALVDDQELVWATGFGLAERRSGRRAAADTVYRVGSISKLFTALGVMALVDQGKLDLDTPIVKYDPDFTIGRGRFPQAKPTTLRQLMTHRSGLPRESPVGSYFDGSRPTLVETVASLAKCELAHDPETVTRYSNIAVALEGFVAAKVAGLPFEEFQRKTLLDPIGMHGSDFRATVRVRSRLASGYMKLADGREIPAPLFPLGTIPAGNLYASVNEMAKFLSFLFRGGSAAGRQIIKPATLASMFEVQYAREGQQSGFGLGFYVGNIDGHRWVGHGGAVYGFSSQIVALPGEKLGVIVCANDDVVNGTTGMIARRAIQWMLAVKAGKQGPPLPIYQRLSHEDLEPCTGHFKTSSAWIKVFLTTRGLAVENMGQTLELRPLDEKRFLAHGGGSYEAPFNYDAEKREVSFRGQKYTRFDPLTLVKPTPPEWRDYLGVYGADFIPTVIEIRHGTLYALVENAFGYAMIPAGKDTFVFPRGLYQDEKLIFMRSADGVVRRIKFSAMEFLRQDEAGE